MPPRRDNQRRDTRAARREQGRAPPNQGGGRRQTRTRQAQVEEDVASQAAPNVEVIPPSFDVQAFARQMAEAMTGALLTARTDVPAAAIVPESRTLSLVKEFRRMGPGRC
jgi:hypothetical protein